MSDLLNQILPVIPSREALLSLLPYFSVFGLVLMGLGVLGRVFLGKRSNLNHGFSSAMAVLFIYITTIGIYVLHPWNLSRYLSPLPLMTMGKNQLVFFPFRGTSLTLICTQLLPLLILCFLVNLIDTFMPQGKTPLGWAGFRFLTVVLSMAAHLGANWAFNRFLPTVLVTYAPAILLGVLALFLFLGTVSFLAGLCIAVVNPVLGALCTFFFSNIIGKQITKAVLTSLVLCLLFFAFDYFGIAMISVSPASLLVYLPAVLPVILIWYLLDRVL